LLSETKAALETLRWGADYLMKCHPENGVFYVQVSDKTADENFWGRIEDGEKLNYQRKSYKIDANHKGTEPLAEAAAALAATSIVFSEIDSYYADDCRRHAEELWEMAWKPDQRRTYHTTFPGKKLGHSRYQLIIRGGKSLQVMDWFLRRAGMGCRLVT
jgi:endoglucanase